MLDLLENQSIIILNLTFVQNIGGCYMYYSYVDDNLIIYNAQKTNLIHTLNEFNAIHPKLKFIMERDRHL
jgi:hypothetical protein